MTERSTMKHPASKSRRGFSLVEMMACVSIIGIVAFLAIPSVTRMRSDSERIAFSRYSLLLLSTGRGGSRAAITAAT